MLIIYKMIKTNKYNTNFNINIVFNLQNLSSQF